MVAVEEHSEAAVLYFGVEWVVLAEDSVVVRVVDLAVAVVLADLVAVALEVVVPEEVGSFLTRIAQ